MADDIVVVYLFLCFKQKTAYEMRISDWSSDVCSSDLSVQPLSVETPAQVKIIFPRRASAKSDLRDIRPCAAIGAAGHADCNRLLGQAMPLQQRLNLGH